QAETEKFVKEGHDVFHDAKAFGGTIAVSCDMCHPDAANTHPETFPKFQVQLGRVALLRDMINWCIQNPARGKPLADDDPRLKAMEAYILAQRKGTALEFGKHRSPRLGLVSALPLRRGPEEIAERPEARLLARLREHLLCIAPLLRLGRVLRLLGALDHREPDAPLRDIELDDRDVDGVADRHDLPRMGHAAVERQARDVHQPVEAGRELHERPELLEPSDRAAHAGSH